MAKLLSPALGRITREWVEVKSRAEKLPYLKHSERYQVLSAIFDGINRIIEENPEPHQIAKYSIFINEDAVVDRSGEDLKKYNLNDLLGVIAFEHDIVMHITAFSMDPLYQWNRLDDVTTSEIFMSGLLRGSVTILAKHPILNQMIYGDMEFDYGGVRQYMFQQDSRTDEAIRILENFYIIYYKKSEHPKLYLQEKDEYENRIITPEPEPEPIVVKVETPKKHRRRDDPKSIEARKRREDKRLIREMIAVIKVEVCGGKSYNTCVYDCTCNPWTTGGGRKLPKRIYEEDMSFDLIENQWDDFYDE